MTSLQLEYQKVQRCVVPGSLIAGGVSAGIVTGCTHDWATGILLGLMACAAYALVKHQQIRDLERIIYPGGKL